MGSECFIITLKWLNENRTPHYGFSGAQVEVVGFSYKKGSLPKGWLHSLVSKKISLEQKRLFEEGQFKTQKQLKAEPDAPIDHKLCLTLSKELIKRIYKIHVNTKVPIKNIVIDVLNSHFKVKTVNSRTLTLHP